MRVGRRRLTKPGLLPGVQEIAGVWYWTPTTKRERDERRKLKAEASARGEKFTIGCTLGPARSPEARRKWTEVSGYADLKNADGTVNELATLWEKDGIAKQANGLPRSPITIIKYSRCLIGVREKFGTCKYGKTAVDVARGQALGPAEVQQWVSDDPKQAMANLRFAVLDNIFSYAIRRGRTTYNPCVDVATNPGGVREREPLPWEVECLRTLAKPRLGLQMDYEAITGWRISGILQLRRAQGTADGVRVRYAKRGKRWLWEWSDELRRIWRESEQLSGATRFGNSPVFPTRTGTEMKYNAFDADWQALKRATNAALAAGWIIDPDTLERHAGLAIENLHFHDLRSKAHDDAEDLDMEGHDFLGNTKAVARRHYRRRARRMTPLK